MTRRRVIALQLLVIVIAGAAVYGVSRWRARPVDGELVAIQDLPHDVRSEVDTVWSAFAARFDDRMTCIPDVDLELVAEVDGGDARYVVDQRRIEIAIPTTPARFRESLAHELAHHVERSCPEFAVLRAELHPLIGADTSWFAGPTWEETPSEIWAEAVVELVNGERVRHVDEVTVDPAVTDAIVAWVSDA